MSSDQRPTSTELRTSGRMCSCSSGFRGIHNMDRDIWTRSLNWTTRGLDPDVQRELTVWNLLSHDLKKLHKRLPLGLGKLSVSKR